MADEVEREVTEDDVEGQQVKHGPDVRLNRESAPGSDAEPTMSEENDVEGQVKH